MKIAQRDILIVLLICGGVLFYQSYQQFPFIVDEVSYLSQPIMVRNIARTLVYLFCYALCIAAIFSLIFLKRKIFVGILAFVFVIAYTVDWVFQLLGNPVGFNLTEYELLRETIGFAANAVEYLNLIIAGLLIAVLFVAVLCLSRRYLFPKVRSDWFLVFPVVAIAATTVASIKVFSITPSSFPAPVKLFSVGAYYEIELLDNLRQERQPVLAAAPESDAVSNIIWVIDESITAGYLAVNGYPKDTSPFLSANVENEEIYNFGIVTSTAPVSKLSNELLRIGLQPKHAADFVERYYTLPTIYQYAKQAGYHTTLFDLQISNGALQNGLNTRDMSYVDTYITADRGLTVSLRDRHALEDLKGLLENNEKNFVVIVKWGAHWPYQSTYSEDHKIFVPALDSMFANMVGKDRERQLNSYLNAVRHAADFYLESLMAVVDLNDSNVIYTSDHGQDLMAESKRTHGGDSNIARAVVEVPLIVFQQGAKSRYRGIDKDTQSAFQIFPTTLDWMGYDEEIVSAYGKKLDQPADPELRSFFATSQGKLQAY
ncbi:MAG: sulfatase-like hydrolase/transferase [Pseudomonadota bacterium]